MTDELWPPPPVTKNMKRNRRRYVVGAALPKPLRERFQAATNPIPPAPQPMINWFRRCVECGRVFDLQNETDEAEWHYGHDCEAS